VLEMFPARVGMNRGGDGVGLIDGHVPRACGDEPESQRWLTQV